MNVILIPPVVVRWIIAVSVFLIFISMHDFQALFDTRER